MSVERDFIIACLKDEKTIEGAINVVQSKFIENDSHRLIYDIIKDHYSMHNEVPNRSYIIHKLKNQKTYTKIRDGKTVKTKLSPETKTLFIKSLKKIYKIDPSSTSAPEIIKDFAREKLLLDSISSMMDHIEDGNVERAYSTLFSLRDSDYIIDKGYKIHNWVEEWEARQEERRLRRQNPERYHLIPTPWKTLNRALGSDSGIGGIQGGEFASIVATSGRGKSIALGNIALFAAIEENNGAFFSIENSAWQTEQRLDSRLLNIPYDDIKGYNCTKKQLRMAQRTFDRFKKAISSRLFVVDSDPRNTNIQLVERAIKDIEFKTGKKLQFIVIDYADLMKPIKKLESFRLEQREVYWDAKALALIRKIPVITATQMKQDLVDKKGYTESLAESADKGRLLDIIFTFYQNAEMKAKNEMTGILAKNRDGVGGIEVPFRTDFSVMSIKEVITR